MDGPEADRGNPLIDSLADWLIERALRDTPLDVLFEGTCKQLHAAGVPLARCHITFRVLHPLFNAQALQWRRDKGVEAMNFLHGEDLEVWRRSPLHYMLANDLPYLRRRLSGDSAMLDFDMLQELSTEGHTDYLGFLIRFNDSHDIENAFGILGSWSTDRRGGFTNADIGSLKRIEQRLAVAFKINVQARITENILSAYLGPAAGEQVLNGQIKRGDGETIRTVIWYSDMRDSTRLADSMSSSDFLRALNEYFESTAGAVLKQGGDVLRFIGDAVLAIFPISDGDTRAACEAAMRAAALAKDKLAEVNHARRLRGEEALDFGLGLHVGELLFGNIGVPARVEYSVIGPAVNEVARLESLTKKLDQQILVSDAFAEQLKRKWLRFGRRKLRGVGRRVAVFAPSPSTE